jgi:hypothetical protein
MAAAAAALLAPLSVALALLFLGVVVFVSLLCPWWLVRIHKFKAKINGPWDEAVPHVPTALLNGNGGVPGPPGTHVGAGVATAAVAGMLGCGGWTQGQLARLTATTSGLE